MGRRGERGKCKIAGGKEGVGRGGKVPHHARRRGLVSQVGLAPEMWSD